MKRIVWHWTGGTYSASIYEKRRYHFLIEGDGKVIEGAPPEANKAPLGKDYVRHTGGLNTDSIGIALCAMGGAQEAPFDAGMYPPTRDQLAALVDLSADLCETYGIKVSRHTTLCHSEVRPYFGRGRYKWDINLLPGMKRPVEPTEAGDAIRSRVRTELQDRKHKWNQPSRLVAWLRRIGFRI